LCFLGTDRTEGIEEELVAPTLPTALKSLAAAATLAVLALVAGCADGGYGDPGGAPLASGQSCGSIRQELDQLDKRGTQGKVEAASQGKKLSAKDKSDVDRYNSLLNQYLGARCHA
jgi:hypothetical protein